MKENLNLPWRLILTITGGVIVDAAKIEVAFCDKESVEQVRSAIEILNQHGE